MLHKIFKKFYTLSLLFENNYHKKNEPEVFDIDSVLSFDLKKNIEKIKKQLGTSIDITIHTFQMGNYNNTEATVIFFDGLANDKIINKCIIKPLLYDIRLTSVKKDYKNKPTIQNIKEAILFVGDINATKNIDQLVDGCLYGDTILLVDGLDEALLIDSKGFEIRGITEPLTEAVVRGPREGFIENLATNIALIRRKIRNQNLTFETFKVGYRTRTDVCIAYLKKVVDPSIVEEVKKRIKRINTDSILESGYIEQFIEDNPLSPFSTIANTEKPDVVAAKLLEGRVAILVDGTPFVLTVPMVFIESFQSAEDYYSRPYYASLVRTMRFIAFMITILAPAIYVALTSFHQELIPTPLLITMIAAKEGTPFPAIVEALGMGLIYEILREAGIRLPRPVGSAISIVGALVIGETAVSAGLIGAPMVIVIALTAISSFVIPAQSDVATMLRFVLTLLAGILGAFGIVFGLLIILIHLASLRSFGTPYLSPLAPIVASEFKDVFVRVPFWAMLTRPRSMHIENTQRIKLGQIPQPPKKDSDKK